MFASGEINQIKLSIYVMPGVLKNTRLNPFTVNPELSRPTQMHRTA